MYFNKYLKILNILPYLSWVENAGRKPIKLINFSDSSSYSKFSSCILHNRLDLFIPIIHHSPFIIIHHLSYYLSNPSSTIILHPPSFYIHHHPSSFILLIQFFVIHHSTSIIIHHISYPIHHQPSFFILHQSSIYIIFHRYILYIYIFIYKYTVFVIFICLLLRGIWGHHSGALRLGHQPRCPQEIWVPWRSLCCPTKVSAKVTPLPH